MGGGTSGQEDLYQFATLADNVKSVVGVQVNTTCERTDGTAFSLKTPVQSGSTTSADAGQAVGGTTFGTIVAHSGNRPGDFRRVDTGGT